MNTKKNVPGYGATQILGVVSKRGRRWYNSSEMNGIKGDNILKPKSKQAKSALRADAF